VASAPQKKAQLFWFPLPKPARTALLAAGLRGPSPDSREFALDDLPALGAWAPQVLVLPLGLALSLADQKQRGLFDLPSLDTAMVVLTSTEDSPLADHHRDLLWHAFGVPVFEQLRGTDGAVIASECEAHDGLHLRNSEPFHMPGEIVADHCACGLETPRLRSVVSVRARSAAAA
jgi:hypothetical protein